jgi:hypothetical protein
MGAALAMFTTVVLLLSLVLVLHHLGVDVTPWISQVMHSLERAVAKPL